MFGLTDLKFGHSIDWFLFGWAAVILEVYTLGKFSGHSKEERDTCHRQALPPNNFGHALFSYTSRPPARPAVSVAKIELLDREIAALELAPVISQSSSASEKPRRRLWRHWAVHPESI